MGDTERECSEKAAPKRKKIKIKIPVVSIKSMSQHFWLGSPYKPGTGEGWEAERAPWSCLFSLWRGAWQKFWKLSLNDKGICFAKPPSITEEGWPGEQLALNSRTASGLGQAVQETVTVIWNHNSISVQYFPSMIKLLFTYNIYYCHYYLEPQQHFSVIFSINDVNYSSYTISAIF